jgi:hypothetical protein
VATLSQPRPISGSRCIAAFPAGSTHGLIFDQPEARNAQLTSELSV